MRTLLTFILALFSVTAFAQGPVVRTPLTTNTATFTSPSTGQIPKIHSVSGGVIVWTNSADTGGVASSPIIEVPTVDHLTNLVTSATNNSVLRLAPGRHTISAFRSANNYAETAHLRIIGKTNIVIMGDGLGTEIFSASLGNFFHIAHSYNIVIKDLTIRGTRAAYATSTNGLFGAINMLGTNNHIRFENVFFKDHSDHAIVSFSDTHAKNSSYVTVDSCVFEDIGATNQPTGGAPDGCAVNVVGSNMQIVNNTFRRCRLGVEFEGAASAFIKNTLIQGNTFEQGLQQHIVQYAASSATAVCTDITIRDNSFTYTAAQFWGGQAQAILLEKVQRVNIDGNTFFGTENAVFLQMHSTHTLDMQDFKINNNRIINNILAPVNGHAIYLGTQAGNKIENVRVSGNYFTNCTWAGVYLFGVQRSIVSENLFDWVGSGSPFGNPITLANSTGASACSSNIVADNVIMRVVGATVPAIEVTGTNNVVTRNRIMHWTGSNPYTLTGVGNRGYMNWIAGTMEALLGNDVVTNSSSSAGLVDAGSGQVDKVWATDGSGNPAWRTSPGGSGSAAGSPPNVQYKHPDGSFAGATGINVDTNASGTNLNTAGFNRNYRTYSSNGITSAGWALFQGSVTNEAQSYFQDQANFSQDLVTDAASTILAGGDLQVAGDTTLQGPAAYTTTTISGTEIDWEGSSARYKQLTANTTFTFANLLNDRHVWVELEQDATGTRTVTWPTVTWFSTNGNAYAHGGVDTNAGKITVFQFWRRSGTVYGRVMPPDTRFDVDWSSGTVPSSDIRSRLSDEVGTGPLMFTRTGVRREVWIGAGAMTPAVTNGAAIATNVVGADGLTLDTLDFDDTTAEYAWFPFWLPDGYDQGTFKVKFVWTTITGSGGVVWGIAAGVVADDGTLNATILGTAQTVADTRLADHDNHITSATASITAAGTPTIDKPMYFRVHRLPTDGSDTKTGDARLQGIKLQYTETATEPSAW